MLIFVSQTVVTVGVTLISAGAGALAALAAPLVQSRLSRKTLEHQLQAEYEYEQRKELRKLIGRYHGRLVEAADTWRNRMTNLYDHQAGEAARRMTVDGAFSEPDYYFGTTVYRFMSLASLARQFEAEAFYLDARIAEKSDLDFLKYVKAFRWIMTDLELIRGLDYQAWEARDHFLNDRYRGLCDAFAPESRLPSLAEFEAGAGRDPALEPVLCFFDGLRADEARLRWDRLVAHHLLVMGFLNLAGYDMQHSSDADIARAVGEFRNPQVAANLVRAIDHLGLGGEENAVRIKAALQARPEVDEALGAPQAALVGKEPIRADV
jgi:hypothetical protein